MRSGLRIFRILTQVFLRRLLSRRSKGVGGVVALPGSVRGRVAIRRNALGIPYVTADNRWDLFAGFGYAVASDRLWQMDIARRLAHGRLAEILGDRGTPGGPAGLLGLQRLSDLDLFYRALGLGQGAQADLAVLSPEGVETLEAFASGVNGYMTAGRKRNPLPIECVLLGYAPEPWSPVDSLAIGRLVGWLLCLAFRGDMVLSRVARFEELRSLLPAASGEGNALRDLPVPPEGGGAMGSNAWVLSGTRTASGKPILCNDPHLFLSLPGFFTQVGLDGAGFKVAGAAIPGVPAIAIGRNDRIAWGMTSAMPDDADLYAETLDPADPSRFRVGEEWRRFVVREEMIPIRGAEPRRVRLRFVPRQGVLCPLMSDVLPGPGVPFSLRWTGLEPSRGLDALLGMNRSANLEDFHASLEHFAIPAQHIVYADITGNIALFLAGRFPRRPGRTGMVLLDGSGEGGAWDGPIPFHELPRLVNPGEGMIVTANHRLVPEEYPHYLTYLWEPPFRADRIQALLNGKGGLSVLDMLVVQSDQVSLQATRLLGSCLAPALPSCVGKAREWAERLLAWDGRMDADSQEAAVYHAFYDRLLRLIFEPRLEEKEAGLYSQYFSLFHLPVHVVDRLLTEADSSFLPEGRDTVVAQALTEAIAFLRKALGPKEFWQWGRMHPLTLRHPLGGSGTGLLSRALNGLVPFNRGPWPHGGDGMTVNVAAYFLSHPYAPAVGPAYRQIVDLGAQEESLWVIPGGASGDPLSPHYEDQLEDWRTGRASRFDLTLEPSRARSTLVLMGNGLEGF
ncbi:MAG: penicillin acylase family protein [Candidatus Methylomirabilales bacterium]